MEVRDGGYYVKDARVSLDSAVGASLRGESPEVIADSCPSLNLGQLRRLAELAERYREQSPDLADICLIRMSGLYPKYPVITVDVKDFSVFRRGRRDTIRLIVPASYHVGEC